MTDFTAIPMNERKALLALARLLGDVSKTRGPLGGEFFEHLEWGIIDGTYDLALFMAKLDVEEQLSGVDGIEGLYKLMQTLPDETRDAIRGSGFSDA